MNLPQRLDPLDLEVAPHEVLPDYEAASAPEYHSGGFEVPHLYYHLRQLDRKLQIFTPVGTDASTYKVASRRFRPFSKKADMELLRVPYRSIDDISVASIAFDDDGPLPWRPRAHFIHGNIGDESKYPMESRNFADWTVVIGGMTYTWILEAQPTSLALSEKTTSLVIARFTYSAHGMNAKNGAEVGDLTMYRDALTVESEGVEKVLCALMIVIFHFKKMGRNYRNDGGIRSASLAREHLPSNVPSFAGSHRPSFAGSWDV